MLLAFIIAILRTCVTKAVAMLEGPENGPYWGGFFFFAVEYPLDYPSKPPTLTFLSGDGTTRLHPNMYINGKVCLSMLNTWAGEKWTACMRILNVLVVLRSRLSELPLLHEPGIPASHPAVIPYTEAIRHATFRIAVLGLFDWGNDASDELTALLQVAREQIGTSPDKYRDILSRHQKEFEEKKISAVVEIPVYKLREIIDYEVLRAALEVKLKNT